MLSALCTQFTYEGLLDETFGVRCGQVAVEVEGTKKVRGLNASDAVWRETRGLSYVAARRWMHETLRSIQSFRDGGMAAADVHTLKGFVAELRDKFSRLPLHVSLIEAAGAAFADPVFATRQAAEASLLAEEDDVGAVEDLLYREAPLPVVLRLLALRSITLGGLPRKRLDTLRRDILNTHGFHHLVTLENLAKAGLLGVRNTRRPSGYSALKDPFRLLLPADEVGGRAAAIDATEPEDVHFTYAGYAPLSVRLIELAVTGGWSAAPSGVSSLPGPAFELQQTVDDKGMPAEVEGASGESWLGCSKRCRRLTRRRSICVWLTVLVQPGGVRNHIDLSLQCTIRGFTCHPLPSHLCEYTQRFVSHIYKPTPTPAASEDTRGTSRRPITLVMFLGGVTAAEVAALRFLASRRLVPCEFVIATTRMVTGSTLMTELCAPEPGSSTSTTEC